MWSDTLKSSVSPGCVTRLHTYNFLAFELFISSTIPSTAKFGNILVNNDPDEKIIKSACWIAFLTSEDNSTFLSYFIKNQTSECCVDVVFVYIFISS